MMPSVRCSTSCRPSSHSAPYMDAVYRRNEKSPRFPERFGHKSLLLPWLIASSALGRHHVHHCGVYPMWCNHVPFHWQPVHSSARIRIPSACLQENCLLIRNSNHRISWFALLSALVSRSSCETAYVLDSPSQLASCFLGSTASHTISTQIPCKDGLRGAVLMPSPGSSHLFSRRLYHFSQIC